MYSYNETKSKKCLKVVLSNEDIASHLNIKWEEIKDKNIFETKDFYLYEIKNKSKIIGILAIKVYGNYPYVDVGVLPEHRGCQIVSAFNSLLKEFCNKKKYQFIFAKIKSDNKRSFVFAKWCGFKKLFKNDDYYIMRFDYGRSR
ncbi:hypothetical protein E6Q11_01830 [Candidatus Dojkabacteria bacterium]|uniref:N-acetyltransferase domain-containing protein n=1 Tax=Candidatus Dojkabacteria bacterium TaxID=2099670 RepID=A0A5C7J8X0_9BACT|nr:MAG: hypothetical protein E6Q11_01830 [Candidatus Dojkabacteria bacterium]